MQSLLARIDRDREEAAKFAAEQRKLAAEASRDRVLAPWLAGAAVIGGLLGLFSFLSRIIHG